jgi:4-diphosphocytidyl-2-C-methyl-D-erythritol kinase
VILRGRGERVTVLPPAAARRLRGQRVLVFKPGFAVSTPWAYARMAATVRPEPQLNPAYVPAAVAEEQLDAWLANESAPLASVLGNNFEPVVFAKHLALPELLAQLERAFGIQPRMSGSGSACFALLEDRPAEPIADAIRRAWGASAFVVGTRLA